MMTWMGPAAHDTWATSKMGGRSITARNAGHGLVPAYQATAAARSGTTPAMARAGIPAWMSYGACWLRAATPRTARHAVAAVTIRTKSRLRRLVGLVRPSSANVGSSLGKDSFHWWHGGGISAAPRRPFPTARPPAHANTTATTRSEE